MVAPFSELDSCRAVEAALPALFLRDLGESLCCFIFRALPASVPFAVAGYADFRFASGTLAVFAAAIETTRGVKVDVGGLYPFSAAATGAVNAVFGGVFLVFFVPFHFEFRVEELLDVFQGYVVCGTAFGWHVRGISDGHGEDATEAAVAHAVAAG